MKAEKGGGTGFNLALVFVIFLFLAASVILVSCDTAGGEGTENGDTNGDTNGDDTVDEDTTAPTVTITSDEAVLTVLSPFSITITFSEPVTDFEAEDITVVNGMPSGLLTEDDTVFTADITPDGDPADITVDIYAGACADSAGNENEAAERFEIRYDTADLTVTITSEDDDPTNVSPVWITVTFSEEAAGFVIDDMTVGNGTADNLQTTDDIEYTADIIPDGEGEVTVDIGAGIANDALTGVKENTAAERFSIVYDSVSPDTAITSEESILTASNPFSVTVEFTEEVTGFELEDIEVVNGTAGNLQAVVENTEFTADISPEEGPVDITVDVPAGACTDTAGNENTAAGQFVIRYDPTALTVSVSTEEPDPTNTSSFEVAVTFSEEVTGFELEDIVVGNGAASSLGGVNPSFTADITPSADGEVTVDIPEEVAVDAETGEKSNYAAEQLSIMYDGSDPDVGAGTITASDQETDSITISWASAADDSPPLQYQAYYSEDGNIDSVLQIEENGDPFEDWETDMTSKTITGLAPAKDYYFNVIVQDDAGNKSAYTMQTETTSFEVLQINPSSNADTISDIAIDGDYLYIAGYDESLGTDDDQWRIEKRHKRTGKLVAGFGTDGVVLSNPSAGADHATAIAVYGSYLYVAGYDDSPGNRQWRVEKRAFSTGALETVSFGTSGVVVSNPSTRDDFLDDIAVDGSYFYIVGYDYSPGTTNYEWRIEKRSMTSGDLETVSFGTSGVVETDPSSSYDGATSIAVDGSYIYVTGYDSAWGNYGWRTEKRSKSTGATIAAFDDDGVLATNPSGNHDAATSIAIDGSYIYLAGYDKFAGSTDARWRIEKRSISDGGLETTNFGSNGVVLSNPSSGNDYTQSIAIDASYLYVAGYDDSPGNNQWRVVKLNITTGAAIGGFGTSGTVTTNPSTGTDRAQVIVLDSGFIYVAGWDAYEGGTDYQWRVERRDALSGGF